MLYFWNEENKIMRYFLALILLLALTVWSCEKDDICSEDTETTPRLVLKFYDNNNPEVVKSVSNILVHGTGNNAVIEGLNGTASRDSIFLPLKTDVSETSFSIYKNASINNNGTPNDTSDDYVEGNEDVITVTYIVKEIYVSRACGYKTIFENVNVSFLNDSDNWIENIQSVDEDIQNIENERAAYFKIFH